jgi:hypothetical protein
MSFRHMSTLSAVFLALLTLSAGAAEPRRIVCDYAQSASPKGLRAEKFRLEFIVDVDRAVMVGNNGISDVEMHAGDHGLTFLEKVPAGVVQTTTVAKDGASVHSRHTIIVKLVPSQYYGQCYQPKP